MLRDLVLLQMKAGRDGYSEAWLRMKYCDQATNDALPGGAWCEHWFLSININCLDALMIVKGLVV
jgi:hypothetical protein